MIDRAVRFFAVNRDGSDGADLGSAWLVDGELDYANDTVRGIMATKAGRFGPVAAMDFYESWSNGYIRSQRVELVVK